jgi:thiamine-monophosphate kinase
MTNDSGGTLQDVGEFALIDRIIDPGDSGAPFVLVGPGDDTAVVLAPDGRVVITCDMLVEGRHFRRDWSTAIDVGRKAAAASLADVAAMGARATSLVVSFGAPGDLPAVWAVSCTAGIREEAAIVGAVIVGGDVVEAAQVVISVTALGDLEGRAPVLRSGARPGDVLAIAGRFGWSAAGLALLQRGFKSPKVLVDAHRAQPPCGAEAAIAGATSMIDVSDRLVADTRHVAVASGVDIAIDTSAWEIPEAMRPQRPHNVDPRRMLAGGEDHAPGHVPGGFAATDRVQAIGAYCRARRSRRSRSTGCTATGGRPPTLLLTSSSGELSGCGGAVRPGILQGRGQGGGAADMSAAPLPFVCGAAQAGRPCRP